MKEGFKTKNPESCKIEAVPDSGDLQLAPG